MRGRERLLTAHPEREHQLRRRIRFDEPWTLPGSITSPTAKLIASGSRGAAAGGPVPPCPRRCSSLAPSQPPLPTQAPGLSCPSDLLLTIAEQGEGGCSFVRVSVPGASRPWPLCDNAVWGPKSCPSCSVHLPFQPLTPLPDPGPPLTLEVGWLPQASPLRQHSAPPRGGETCRDHPPAASGPGNS